MMKVANVLKVKGLDVAVIQANHPRPRTLAPISV